MKRILFFALLAVTAIALFAQRQSPAPDPARPSFETTAVFPHETSPGQYSQAEPSRLQDLSAQGWELVSVTPFIFRNEEHNNGEMHGPKPVVTQVYPAYFFKRLRTARF